MRWTTGLSPKTLLIKSVIAGAFFSAMAIVKTYPLIGHFGTHVPNDLGDPLLTAWILAWDFRALTTDPWNFFNANILYPAQHTLAFSEHLIGVLPIFAPAYALTANPIFAYNMVFFLSFPLSGVTMFLLVHHWTRNFSASLVSGCLFAFAPVRFGQLSHLQLLNLYWAPLTFLYLDKFLCSRRWTHLAGFAICYWWQMLCSVYLGWLTTVAVVLYALYYALFIDTALLSRWMITRYATFAGMSVLLLLPLHFPYYTVNQQWRGARPLEECVFYSADLFLSPLSVPPLLNDLHGSLFGVVTLKGAAHEKSLFPGFLPLFLVALGSLPASGFLASAKTREMKRIFWLILIASFILSLGPFLIILNQNTRIPLPYLSLYHLVPGFKSMRAPARFSLMMSVAASVLAGLGLLRTCNLLSARGGFRGFDRVSGQSILAFCCLGVFILELGFKPLPLATIETGDKIPAVYRWFADKSFNGPIVELPFGHWEDYRYTYFSTYHWLPIVNGTSGFVPPSYSELMLELDALPSPKAVESLSAIGIKGVVLHTDRLQPPQALRWNQANLAEVGLEKVAAFGPDVVYKLPAVEVTHQLHMDFLAPAYLSAGAKMRLGLLTQGMGDRPWTHPQPLGRTRAIVEWTEA